MIFDILKDQNDVFYIVIEETDKEVVIFNPESGLTKSLSKDEVKDWSLEKKGSEYIEKLDISLKAVENLKTDEKKAIASGIYEVFKRQVAGEEEEQEKESADKEEGGEEERKKEGKGEEEEEEELPLRRKKKDIESDEDTTEQILLEIQKTKRNYLIKSVAESKSADPLFFYILEQLENQIKVDIEALRELFSPRERYTTYLSSLIPSVWGIREEPDYAIEQKQLKNENIFLPFIRGVKKYIVEAKITPRNIANEIRDIQRYINDVIKITKVQEDVEKLKNVSRYLDLSLAEISKMNK